MRKVSMATRAELILAIRGRYGSAGRPEKAKILDEFVALTGFHRKHAMRLLRGSDEPAHGVIPDARPRPVAPGHTPSTGETGYHRRHA